MKNRSELREISMKSLYSAFVMQNSDLEFNINEIIRENIEIENDFVNTVVKGTLEKLKEIKEYANKYMENWSIDRLNLVDQAILSQSIYELIYTDTPSIVVINEGVELAKKYSDEKVVKMINGVLDNIYHNEEDNER